MDPTTAFCPNPHGHARGQSGQGNIGIHSRKAQRFLCHECHKTFSATTGTVFYRLHTSAETVVLVVTLLAHGCPVQANALWADDCSCSTYSIDIIGFNQSSPSSAHRMWGTGADNSRGDCASRTQCP
jgi:hypothetical protein